VAKQDRDLEKLLEQAPWMRKWVHECVACHERGYKPEMEKSDAYNLPVGSKLRRLVNKMFLNEAGVCEECFKISGHSG
jgi:hypothetical protein